MQKRWRDLFAASLLGLVLLGAWYSSAQAIDLTPRPEASPVTSVADIEAGNLPAITSGVESLFNTPIKPQALEYTPTTVAEIQSIPSDIKFVSRTPADSHAVAPIAAPSYLVFPVLVHDARDKAFSDLPIMMSSAVANQLSRRISRRGYSVLNPIYAYDALRDKGLTSLYETIMRDYVEAGSPNEQDIEVLADQLSTKSHQVNWVIFVEAGFDTDHTRKRIGLADAFMYNVLDTAPAQPHFFVNGAVRVFNIHNTERPLWSKEAKRPMSQDAFGNFTKSVFDDSDSVLNFRNVSGEMAREMIGGLNPPRIVQQSALAGEIVDNHPSTGVVPLNVTPADQQALKNLEN